MSDRLDVRKTYKLYIGGAFPRSESGRSYPVSAGTAAADAGAAGTGAAGTGAAGTGAADAVLAHAAQASRKDVRDAVSAARKAFGGWSGATAYNRSQVLYRVAEMMEGRREQFIAEVLAGDGGTRDAAATVVDAAIDRWVWYAGWADKYAQIAGGANPVAGPYFNFSVPEPSGVVGIIAPQQDSLLGLVSVIAPAITTGNTVVVVAATERPLAAITLSEVLATADLPGGVVNVLTGYVPELAPWLASHRDVNCLDLTGVPAADRVPLAVAAADSVKRVHSPGERAGTGLDEPGLARLAAFVEIKTVWHPLGV